MAKIVLSLLGAVLLGCLAYGSRCPEQNSISRHVICYYEGRTPLENINLCNCTHIILTNVVRVTDNYTINFVEDGRRDLDAIKDRKPSLIRIFALNGKHHANAFDSADKTRRLTDAIAEFLRQSEFNGVEIDMPFEIRDSVGKESITSFVKVLRKTLENSAHLRVKRGGYDVSENLEDDITTAPYRTPTARSVRSNEKYETNKKTNAKRRKNYRGGRYNRKEQQQQQQQEEEVESRTEKRSRRMRKELRRTSGYEPSTLILVRLPTNPEVIAKKFDLKALSKYADLLIVSTHNITDQSEAKYTYHPSRLMGLSDMLNADSILDFLSGLGVTKSKIVLTLPATILKFRLQDAKKTTPRSFRIGEPEVIDQSQLCSLFSKGNWTVERDDDLTAPYAFSGKTWLAYEDRVSVNIKAKYILLRELAGGAIYPIDADTGRDPCNDTSVGVGFLANTLYKNVMSLERKPRGLVLESLQQDIHDTAYSAVEAGVHLSEYRIVRVVDHSGAVHVIRKNTKTQFECSRQGYFSHPLGCNKFYRCVKFNQYIDDFTVFEYDCPAGLAFDERWEVCVWPGSLPHGAPCTGSSEIAPVPRSHYQCPAQEGYYADPENCRWFFACLDHARDGVTPLTAYEFRCPFGLVFNEQKLVCDWPWNVGVCGNRGFSGVILEHHGGSSASLQSATFGSYGATAGSGFAHSTQYSGSAGGFGASAGSAHSSGQTGYIAGHYEDNQDRASFGTVPEYEISGGRILNRGGLVLNQNLNLAGAGVGGLNSHSSGFQSGAYDAGHVTVSTASPVVHTVQTVTPSPGLAKLNLAYNPPLSSPRPFSVNVPEVQVNQEQHSLDVAYVGGSTTSSPETVVYVSGGKSGDSGSVNTFTVSSESGEYVRDDTGFGDKVNVGVAVSHGAEGVKGVDIASGQGFGAVKTVGVAAGQGYDTVHTVGVAAGRGFDAVNTVGIAAGQGFGNVQSVGTAAGQGYDTVKTFGVAAGQGYDTVQSVGIAAGQGYDNVKTVGVAVGQGQLHVTTPSPVHQVELQGVQGGSGGYASISGTTAGYDSGSVTVGKTISVSPNVYQVSTGHGSGGAAFGVTSTTPSPDVYVHNAGISETTVLVTPKPEIHTYLQSGGLHKTSGLSAVGLFTASNGSESFVHRPVVEVSTVAPQYAGGYAGHSFSANSGFEQLNYGSNSGNGILLEENVERVVIPKVVSSPAPVLSYQQQSVKPAVFSSTPKPTLFSAVTPSTQVTVERQNFIGPIVVSSPAPFSHRKETVVSTPATAVFQGPSEKFVSTPSPALFNRPSYNFGGRFDGKVNVVQQVQTPVVEEFKVVSSPAPAVFQGPEYLPPVESGVSVQQDVKQFVRPTKITASTPSPAVYGNYQYSSGVVRGQSSGGVSVVQGSPIVETKFISSTPSPTVFTQPEYNLQGLKSVQQNVQTYSQGPVVEQVEIVQPVVSTPAPAVFKRPQYFGFGTSQGSPAQGVFRRPQYFGFGSSQGGGSVKSSVQQNVQTYSQAPVVEQISIVSTPAPAVYNRQEYVSFGGAQGQKSSVNTYSQSPVVEEIKVVQPVVSTPAPAVFNRQQFVGGAQGQKSSVQQNIQTYSQVPVVEEIKVVSSPSPAVYNRQEFVSVGGVSQGQKSSVQQNIQTYAQAPVVEEIKVVSTPAPAVYNRQEFVAVGGIGQGHKSSVQQNFQTYTQAPVVEQINLVSTPAPAVYNRQEFVAVGGAGQGQKSSVQQNFQTYSQSPVVEEIKVVQPVVSTQTPAVYNRQEFVSVGGVQGQKSLQQNFKTYSQAPVVEQINLVSTPAPAVYNRQEYVSFGGAQGQKSFNTYSQSPVVGEVKVVQPAVSTPAAPVLKEYISPGKSSVTVQQNYNRYVPSIQTQFVSTPAPTVFTKTEFVDTGVKQNVQNLYKGPEYLPPVLEQNVELKSEVRGNVQTYSQPQVKYTVSTPAPVVQNNANFRQQFVQTPIRSQTYNFVPSTTITPINVQQDVYRSRAKSKQLFGSVAQQPQISVTYEQPQEVVYSKSTPSPTPAQIFGYQSTSGVTTLKPTVYIEEVTTPRPYVYEEYVEISTPKPTGASVGIDESSIRVQQPIVVTEKPVYVQPKKEGKTIYYENYEGGNAVLTALEKEVVQPVVQQETYTVSSESPIVNVEEIVDYLPPTGEEIDSYSNFDFQKVGKAKSGVLVQNGGARGQTYQSGVLIQNGGARGQTYESGYRFNNNIQIAPPSQEYILSVTPKTVTTTVAPETSTYYRPRARPTTSTTAKYVIEGDYDEYVNNDGKATIFSVGQVDSEELDEENVESLLQKYSGDFGNVLGRDKFVTKVVKGEDRGEFVLGNRDEASTIGYEVSTSKSRGRYKNREETSEDATVASLDLKNLKIKKNKKTVIIVSQVSDANPLLIGKLAGQCSCQSNSLQIRKKVRVNGRTSTTSTTYRPDESASENVLDSLAIEAITPKSSTENVILIDGSRTVVKTPVRKFKSRPSGRSRSRYDDVTGNEISQALFSPVPADEIAGNSDYSGNGRVAAGAAFDRYGPGGVRGIDETLQGSVDCERPGLFRHPKYCNKFYACNYDPWKKRYTLHVFNCPIHLSYDSSISACNWPSKGPACSDDHLLL